MRLLHFAFQFTVRQQLVDIDIWIVRISMSQGHTLLESQDISRLLSGGHVHDVWHMQKLLVLSTRLVEDGYGMQRVRQQLTSSGSQT